MTTGERFLRTNRLAPGAAHPRWSGERPRNDLVTANGLVDALAGANDQRRLLVRESVLEMVLGAGHPGDQEPASLPHGADRGALGCSPTAAQSAVRQGRVAHGGPAWSRSGSRSPLPGAQSKSTRTLERDRPAVLSESFTRVSDSNSPKIRFTAGREAPTSTAFRFGAGAASALAPAPGKLLMISANASC